MLWPTAENNVVSRKMGSSFPRKMDIFLAGPGTKKTSDLKATNSPAPFWMKTSGTEDILKLIDSLVNAVFY